MVRPYSSRVHAPYVLLLMALVLAVVMLVRPASPVAAVTQGSIETAGPLTTITISRDLNCDVRYLGDTAPEFYSGTACATLVSAAGTLFGPSYIPAGGGASPRTGFTPVSQVGPTGTGTASDPFRITTVVDLGATGLRLTQVDTYITGQQSYKTTVTIENTTASSQSVNIYRAGDCYVSNSDYGYGGATGESVACISTGGRVAQWIPLTSGSSYMEDSYYAVWQRIGSRQLFPDTVREDDYIDNGAGLSWPGVVPAGGTSSFVHSTAFSPDAVIDDRDGDGLPDDWESNGLDVDKDGDIDIDLASMGASPDHKDLFIEVDWMEKERSCWAWIFCSPGLNFEPDQDALKDVVAAFADAPVDNPDGTTGIRLHVDSGSDAVMNPATGAKWGDKSRANRVTYHEVLGEDTENGYDWSAFNALKASNFESARADVFHYTIYADRVDDEGHSGIAQVGDPFEGDSFIISQGGFNDGSFTRRQESGTFMHEFGHVLSLKHGGGDHIEYKPNYLSIMNYAWQLTSERPLDYSRSSVQDLWEEALWEKAGLPGAEGTYARFCPDPDAVDVNGTPTNYVKHLQTGTGGVDWNCNGTLEDVVVFDINTKPGSMLYGFEDWSNLVYDGGAVGAFGASDLQDQAPPLVFTTEYEATVEELKSRDSLAADGDGTVTLDAPSVLFPGVDEQHLSVHVTNAGNVPASYSLSLIGLPGVDSPITVPEIDGYTTEPLLIPVDATTLSPGTYTVEATLYRPDGGDHLSRNTLEIIVPDMTDPEVRAQAEAALLDLSTPQEGLDEDLRSRYLQALTSALGPQLTLQGFYPPIVSGTDAWNTVKAGSTVSLRFEILEDEVEATDTELVASITQEAIDCDTAVGGGALIDLPATGKTVLRYDDETGKFVKNWKVPRTPGACYNVTLTTTDGSTLTALFALK